MTIKIKNKLLVIGNRVKVPGFEPLSEQTTNNLSLALQGSNTFIDLELALKLIPGSKLIIPYAGPTSGSFGHDKWFEIPDGPPPDYGCPENYIRDVYKILQDNSRNSLSYSQGLMSDCNEYDMITSNNVYNDFCEGLK